MIVEQRTYTVPHGTMTTYLERYEKHALPVQMKHLGRLLGFYVTEIGTLNQVVHLWAYDSLSDREQRREKLAADPAWQEFTRINAGSFVHQEVKIMKPARFSPDLKRAS